MSNFLPNTYLYITYLWLSVLWLEIEYLLNPFTYLETEQTVGCWLWGGRVMEENRQKRTSFVSAWFGFFSESFH